MSLLIQKFGGTSVSDPDKILAAASRAIRAHQMGAHVVVVVSARGHTTDELIATARQLSARPSAREIDMLLATGEQVSVALMAIAIQSLGVPSISFTGSQIGLVTDSFHTKARIRNISTDRILAALDDGKIVIVAGFQGVDEDYNITTLGRGGSDTTAVALAAVLGADACEIYTDVDGVYTTDPRIVPEASKIDRISYDEMLELASLGAGVMHSRSIEFAKKYDVPIHVRTSACDSRGTWIVGDVEAKRLGVGVTGAALTKHEARVTLTGVPDDPEAVHTLFRHVADANVLVDMIVRNVAEEGSALLSFTVAAADLDDALLASGDASREIGATSVTHDGGVSKLSIVGMGMRAHVGVAATMFAALSNAGVNIQMISTSDIKISVLIDRPSAERALVAVHRAFDLHRPSADLSQPFSPRRPAKTARSHVMLMAGRPSSPPPGMEDLVISGIELDESQGRITVRDVPDQPGRAAEIFGRVSEANIPVDMIVQNVSREGCPNLSFTVRRDDADAAAAAAASVVGPDRVLMAPNIAKLSLLGVGMRTNVGVATRMFRELAKQGIPLDLINTSEVRINVATELDRGREGQACLQCAFPRDDECARGDERRTAAETERVSDRLSEDV